MALLWTAKGERSDKGSLSRKPFMVTLKASWGVVWLLSAEIACSVAHSRSFEHLDDAPGRSSLVDLAEADRLVKQE